MIETLTSQSAALIGLLVGVLATLFAVLLWAPRALRQRFIDGAASRQSEIDALDQRADELASATADREAQWSRERERGQRLEAQLHLLMREHGELRGRLARLDMAEALLQQRDQELVDLRARHAESMAQVRALETRLADEIRAAEEKLAFIGRVRGEFSDAFKALAGEVLEDKSQRLIAENSAQIGGLLTPVREQLKTFQDAVQQA